MEVTIANVLTGLGVLVSMATLAFGIIKWVQSQVREVRADADREITRLEAKVETIRAECAKREDFAMINGTMSGLSNRLDAAMTNLGRRMDEIMSLMATTRVKD